MSTRIEDARKQLTLDGALDADNAQAGNEGDVGVFGDGLCGGEGDVVASARSGAGLRWFVLVVVVLVVGVAEAESERDVAGLVSLGASLGDDRKGWERLEGKRSVGLRARGDESGCKSVDRGRIEGLSICGQQGNCGNASRQDLQFRRGWQMRPRRWRRAAERCAELRRRGWSLRRTGSPCW